MVVLLGASLTFTAAMVALNSGAQNQIANVKKQVGTGITISPANSFGPFVAGTLSTSQIRSAEQVPDIVGATETVESRYTGKNLYGSAKLPARFQQGGPIFRRVIFNTGKGGTIEPTITGITGAASRVTLFGGAVVHMSRGRDLSTSDAGRNTGLMAAALANANKLSIGSTFKLNSHTVRLVGEYTTGQSFGDNSIVLPLKLAQRVLKLDGVTGLTVYAATAGDVNLVAANIRSALGNGVDITTQNQTYASTFDALNSTSHNIQSALVASIITAALVIVFAVFIMVRERTREIGVLKAIGASSANIVAQFTSEVLSLSVTAAVAAAVLLAVFGGQIARAFDISTTNPPAGVTSAPGGGFGGTFVRFTRPAPAIHTPPLSAGLNPESLLVLLAIAVALAVVASWIPTWYVSRVRPARVLSNA